MIVNELSSVKALRPGGEYQYVFMSKTPFVFRLSPAGGPFGFDHSTLWYRALSWAGARYREIPRYRDPPVNIAQTDEW